MGKAPKYQTGGKTQATELGDGRKYVNYKKGDSSIDFVGTGDSGTVKATVASPTYKGFTTNVNAAKDFTNRNIKAEEDPNNSYDVGAGLRYNSSGGIDFGADVSGDTDKTNDVYDVGANIGITKRNISANTIAKARFDRDKKDYEIRSAASYNPQVKGGQLGLTASLENMFNTDGVKRNSVNAGANYISNNGISARGGYNRSSSPDITSSNASIGGSYTYNKPKFGASASVDKIFSANAPAGSSKPLNSKSTVVSGSFNANLYKGLNIRGNAGFNANNNGKNINSSLGAAVGYNHVKRDGTRPTWGANISGGINSSYVKRSDGTYAKTASPNLSGSVYRNVGKNTNITLGKSFNKVDKENNRGITLGVTSRF